MQKVHCRIIHMLQLLLNIGFQVLFTPFYGSFQLSLTVLCSLSIKNLFRLRGWYPFLQTKSCILFYSFISVQKENTGLSPFLVWFSNPFSFLFFTFLCLFWIRSPLLTKSLFDFFSFSYLDVSIHWIFFFFSIFEGFPLWWKFKMQRHPQVPCWLTSFDFSHLFRVRPSLDPLSSHPS